MGIEPLAQAPPTLYKLFKDLPTIEEKAFKFLELFYNLGNQARVGKALKIDPKTAGSINEFLKSTEAGQRFNALLLEQTETFYSTKTFTTLFEGFNSEIERVESLIRDQDKMIKRAEDNIKELKAGEDSTVKLLTENLTLISKAQTQKIKLITEKRAWMSKLLETSLACRNKGGELNMERKKDDIKKVSTDYDDLLDDFNPDTASLN